MTHKATIGTIMIVLLFTAGTLPVSADEISTPGILPKSVGVGLTSDGDAATTMAECDFIGFACAGAAAFVATICAEASGVIYILGIWPTAGHVNVCTTLYAAAAGSTLFFLVGDEQVCEITGDKLCETIRDLGSIETWGPATGTGRAWVVGYDKQGTSWLLNDEQYSALNGCIADKALEVQMCGAAAGGGDGDYYCIKAQAHAQSFSMGMATSLQEADGISSSHKCVKVLPEALDALIGDPVESETHATNYTVADLSPEDRDAFVQEARRLTHDLIVGACPSEEESDPVSECGVRQFLADQIEATFDPSEWPLTVHSWE